ncbi:SBBP repeat-containing protein [Prochlorococcus sp. MIT 1306]|uniref:SBBP repeat-containing protein n=1 Tax=Prochlorococcus sp. MIT 1306 TaxID=1799667 RepID=UPI0007B32636|nr:SBBP repeat-containing protein [Prochlorococcus sp. MIT 1306]KZR64318.1 Beta-propeller repeat [Prochlorococcus sp. MIT 1306]
MVTSNPNQNDLNLDGPQANGDVTKTWTQQFGSNARDEARALTTGSDGSIYIAGSSWGDLDGQSNGGGSDAFLTKYDADGNQAWTRLLGTSSAQRTDEWGSGLTTGSDGSIYITGYTEGDLDGQENSGLNDAFLSKYDSNGNQEWTELLGTTKNDMAVALTTGSDGSIYIAGRTWGDLDGQSNSGDSDVFLTKYGPDGNQKWTQLLGSTTSALAKALTTGSDGSIYIAGMTWGDLDGQENSGGSGSDAFLSKYDPDGSKEWSQLFGTTREDSAFALTTGTDGAIYIAGRTWGDLDGQSNNGNTFDAFLSKYEPDGNKDWTQLLGTTSVDIAHALTTGKDGSIYIAGHTTGNLDGQENSGGDDAFLTKYNADGTKDWTQLLGTPSTDVAHALTTGSDGSIYIAGCTGGDLDGESNSGKDDAFLTKFEVTGSTTQSGSPTDGGYLSLSGNNSEPFEYVVIEDSPSLSIEGEITISSWIYRSDNAGDDWRNLYDIPDAHLFEFDPSGGFNWRAENNNIDFNINGPVIQLEEWVHVAATMSKNADESGGFTADVFVNGQLANRQLNSVNVETGVRDVDSDLYLGILWSQQHNPDAWAGGIDDFKIWNTALTSEQIAALYDKSDSVARDSLVAEYKFNTLTDDIIIDSSGHENHGRLVGGEIINPINSGDSYLNLDYSLTSNTTGDPLTQLAVLGDPVDHSNRYTLDITAESLKDGFDIEAADITISFDPKLFNNISISDIKIGDDMPIANAVSIDNESGTIRLAAASLSDLSAGTSISAERALASIALDFDESQLETITRDQIGSLDGNPLAFSITANSDETIFSRQFDDGTGLFNREIQTLGDLGGSISVDGTDVTLYEAMINLEEQGDGLVLGTNRVIGSDQSFTNLIRTGDTVTATSEWLNVGNTDSNNIQVTGIANANAYLESHSFVDNKNSLVSGSFIEGEFVKDARESTTLTADIKITGAAGNVVDLSDGILKLQADGSNRTFTNTEGSSNLITYQGDLNYDGRVSMKDLAYLNAGAARQQTSSQNTTGQDQDGNGVVDASVAHDVDADFNGKIDLADLSVLDADWGKSLHDGDQNFVGSGDVSWNELDSQGTTGDAAWDNDSFKNQNAIEASSDYVSSLEAPGTSGVIGADGNEDANDNDMQGDVFQDPLSLS